MRYLLFGPTGLRVSELFLGAMTFGEQGGVGAQPEECARILDTYAKAGRNVVDTAVNYRGGQSEDILGQLPQGRRDRFVLSTTYTLTRDRDDPNAAGNHRKNLRRGFRRCLSRSQLAAPLVLLPLDYADRRDRKHVHTGGVCGKGIGYPIGVGCAWIPG